jgi:hypothetical protein
LSGRLKIAEVGVVNALAILVFPPYFIPNPSISGIIPSQILEKDAVGISVVLQKYVRKPSDDRVILAAVETHVRADSRKARPLARNPFHDYRN